MKARKIFRMEKLSYTVQDFKKQELLIFRIRPMCWLAIGFLLIISMFLVGRSYKETLYQGDIETVYLEGKIVDKQYKDSGYGGYWQITLKKVKVLHQGVGEGSMTAFQRMDENGRKAATAESKTQEDENGTYLSSVKSTSNGIETLEGKYLCWIQAAEDTDFKIGQQILLEGKYTPWDEPTNPGQFDSGKYYCSQGILGQFKKCKVIKQGSNYSGFQEGMWRFQQETDSFLKQELGEDDGALISAMLLGEKSGLNEEDKNLYQRNGISHILAISGLHLMLLGMGVFRVLKMIWGSGKGVAVFSIIIMSIYCVFTGNSISTIRATIMFALSLTAGILGRSYDSLSALGLAAIIQLFINPYVLNNSGFLLSFLAVIGVTFLAPRLQELLGAQSKIAKSLCVSISSSITTLPVLLSNYGTYPWYSVFLNLFILPAMSVLLFLAVVLVILSVPAYLGAGAMAVLESGSGMALFLFMKIKDIAVYGIKLILKYFEICCKIFEHAPFQDGYLGSPTTVQIVVYGVLVAIAISGLIKHSWFVRKMILLSAITVLTMQFNFGTELTMLDVGQGDSMVIRNSSGSVYISDCGSSSVSKVGKYRLIPFLKYKGYGKIKGIFISHLDEDHMNGIIELLEMAPEEKIEISYLFLPESALWIEEDLEIVEELQKLAKQNDTKLIYLKQGDKIKDGQMEFLCLHPVSAEKQESLEENKNNQSLVLFMTYGNFEMLLTGDVEKAGEMEVVEYIEQLGLQSSLYTLGESGTLRKEEESGNGELSNNYSDKDSHGRLSRCDVLKVAHHGSSGSSSEAFLEAVNPKISLISCGKNNSYGHPHEETLERIQDVGSEWLITPESGAITLKIGKEVRVYEFRK